MSNLSFPAAQPLQSRIHRNAILMAWPWLFLLGTFITAPLIFFPGQLIPNSWQPVIVLWLLLLGAAHGALYLPYHQRTRVKRKRTTALSQTNSRPWLWLGLLLWPLIPVLIAINSTIAWTAAGYLYFGMLLYQALQSHQLLQQQKQWQIAMLELGALATIVIMPPLVQWKSTFRLFYVPIYDWFQLIPLDIGEKIHANVLAGALVQLTILMTALALPPLFTKIPFQEGQSGRTRFIKIKNHKSTQVQRWLAAVLAALLFCLLLLTQSRGAYLAVSVGMLLLVMLRWPRLMWSLPIFAIFAMLVLYQVGLSQTMELLGADNTFGGAEWRNGVWHIAGQALHDFPYTGIGLGNFRPVMTLLYPHPVMDSESANHAHNIFLQIGLDIGLPGLFAYYLFVGTILWKAWQHLRLRAFIPPMMALQGNENTRHHQKQMIRMARQHTVAWALTAGAFTAIIAIQIHGMLDAITWGTKLSFLPWLCFALIQLNTDESNSTDP